MIMATLDSRRFDALASYARHPQVTLISDEIGWYATPDERLLGIVLYDRIDRDFSWIVFGLDEVLKFRACEINTCLSSPDDAYEELMDAMNRMATLPDDAFHQGDAEHLPIDFFASVIPPERQHPSFKILMEEERYSPARCIIEAMMRSYEDVDGIFINNFQAGGFDARIWELYLNATFNELNFIRLGDAQVPDFVLMSPRGRLAVEATSANPPDGGGEPIPTEPEAFKDYHANFIPIKLAQALKSKLNHRPAYWESPEVADTAFCLALQDFHAPGAMRFIVPAVTEYVFGVRHSIVDGERFIERIRTHRYGNRRARSGFFFLPNSEHISAVIVNPQGTLTKFNRMGFMTGFGNPDIEMVRTGIIRRDGDANNPAPKPFRHVLGPQYNETWVEGMVVLHNPNANIPLDTNLLPGANHEFLQDDGTIMSLLPDFHPYSSQTHVKLKEK